MEYVHSRVVTGPTLHNGRVEYYYIEMPEDAEIGSAEERLDTMRCDLCGAEQTVRLIMWLALPGRIRCPVCER